jgi:iron-sulfur cluster assembly protein
MSIQVTEKAARHIRRFLDKDGGVGLRFGVKTVGCSGLSYTFDRASHVEDGDAVFETENVTIVVKKTDLIFLDGSTLDFEKQGLNELFKVTNPKAAATCGCGESFTIEVKE